MAKAKKAVAPETAPETARKHGRKGARPAAEPIKQQYVSRAEIAQMLGCSRKFVVELVRRGQLPEHRINPVMLRYRLEDVEKLLDSRRVPAKEAA